MTTFGFSAFLKLVCSNERPQASLIRERLTPSEGGYDYHRSLKQRAQRYLVEGEDFETVLHSANLIRSVSERNSAEEGLNQLHAWRNRNPGEISTCESIAYTSPLRNFSVVYSSGFVLSHNGTKTAFHLWNNLTPALIGEQVFGALSLFAPAHPVTNEGSIDLAVLSLRNLEEFRLSQVPDHSEIGENTIRQLERQFQQISSELGLPAPAEPARDIPMDRPQPRP